MAGRDDMSTEADWEGPFTRIGNQLLEAIPLAKLNRTQENICIFLWRRTYGWNRTMDAISLSALSAACGSCKEHISKQIKILMSKHIIKRIFIPGRSYIYSFISDVTEWEDGCVDIEALEQNRKARIYCCAPEEKIDLSTAPDALWSDDPSAEIEDLYIDLDAGADFLDCPVMEEKWLTDYIPLDQEHHPRSSVQGLSNCTTPELSDCTTHELSDRTTPEQAPTSNQPETEPLLNTVKKTDRKTKRNRKEFTPDMISYQLSKMLFDKVRDNIPDLNEPDMQSWSLVMDRILRIDKKDSDLIKELIEFSQNDDFWCTIIHNPKKLRKHINQLDLQRKRQHSGPRSPNNRRGREAQSDDDHEYDFFFK